MERVLRTANLRYQRMAFVADINRATEADFEVLANPVRSYDVDLMSCLS